ncbi:unnamed protein product [Cyprideis torosa]|uniref:GDP-fucose protein O-fucosyltransferase 2 n=1 Tax=Cyprideis torosa TaxID=163714 RepID=A0A7R8W071_9CRUS|nr:unnamed protein product [Cyprideis torosa]CAG0879424.1 unnamed protein product [Cyprideis torosa]
MKFRGFCHLGCPFVLLIAWFPGVSESTASLVSSGKASCLTSHLQSNSNALFLVYTVNPGEGFNLIRDVYLRVASLIKLLNDNLEGDRSVVLVLPPWGPLYHWMLDRRMGVPRGPYPWSTFFDIQSLSRYIPVMEFEELICEEDEDVQFFVDHVVVLQNFLDMFESGDFSEKYEVSKCQAHRSEFEPVTGTVAERDDSKWEGVLFGDVTVRSRSLQCVSLMGGAHVISPYLLSTFDQSQFILLERAEVLLHENFGEREYWRARESMRFAPKLVLKAKEFIEQMFPNQLAILDQIICSMAKYFIGTQESTFSFRIREEREMIGFNSDTTFNAFCGGPNGEYCEAPSRWTIVR